MAWWVLNVVAVVIAVFAISRRSSSPRKSAEEDE
jgi:hypothetical protein